MAQGESAEMSMAKSRKPLAEVSINIPPIGRIEARTKPVIFEIPDSEEDEDSDSDATIHEDWKSIGAVELRASGTVTRSSSPSPLSVSPKVTATTKKTTKKTGRKNKTVKYKEGHWRAKKYANFSEQELEEFRAHEREVARKSYVEKIKNFTEEELEEYRAHENEAKKNWRAKLTEEEHKEYRAHRNEGGARWKERERKRVIEEAERTYPVLKQLPLETEETTSTEWGLSILACGRASNKVNDEAFEDAKRGNEIVLNKFIDDLIAPIPIPASESTFWNGRKAWAPLPWTSIDDDNEIQYPEGNSAVRKQMLAFVFSLVPDRTSPW